MQDVKITIQETTNDTIIKFNIPNSGVRNITDRYLNEIKTEQLESIWEEAKVAILKTFDFFENHMYLNI